MYAKLDSNFGLIIQGNMKYDGTNLTNISSIQLSGFKTLVDNPPSYIINKVNHVSSYSETSSLITVNYTQVSFSLATKKELRDYCNYWKSLDITIMTIDNKDQLISSLLYASALCGGVDN